MNGDDRKAAIRDYKERKPAPGIYALRCSATGECWVGRAPNLGTIQNRLWFTLRQGMHRDAALQAAWRTHGADTFTFEIVDELDEDEPAYARDRILKERLAHWGEALEASPLLT
jgi:hypothetical protein